tara:strand:+ start:584 stop:2431 length:1848 start_codon:yes stop_codon:yes gene_type:complete
MAINRDIKYVNRDFTSLRNNLVDYTKTYFPNTYTDFSPSSPGMMFMEMAAYVGDVLSFYVDNQFQETFIQYARQSQNLYDLAYMMGYKPKSTSAATTQLDIYQQLPSILSASIYIPDYSYALQIPQSTTVTSNLSGSLQFVIQEKIDFASSGSMDETTSTVYQTAGGNPTYFLIKKTRNAISAAITTTSFNFTSPIPFSNRIITNENIIGILDITDSNGDEWYEVDYLAQDAVYDSIKNSNPNNPNLSTDTNIAYLLKTKQVAKRFASRFLNKTNLQLQFGSGNPEDTTEELIPNPKNVGLGLPSEQDKLTTAFSPTNYIFTNSYGIAPSNTTLTVRYLVGGGVTSNAPANTLTNLNTTLIKFTNSTVANSTLASQIFGTLLVNNPSAATGGSDGDDINEIRQNSMGNFQNQLRNVTFDDYVIRALSLPPIYGTISKVFASKPQASSNSNNTLDLYVLSYNDTKELTTATPALKQNLSTYLSEYKMINDAIGILDAFIINIGINFEIITLPSYNSDEVILKCITALQQAFNIDLWQINQPILLRDINVLLDNIDGVQTVKKIEFINKTGENLGYSDYSYDILGATSNNVVYPSIDPMIFELKYPNTDIQGKVVPL